MLGTVKLGTFMLGTGESELTFGFGQAQAEIINPIVYAQAQAQIKQTYYVTGQSHSSILQIYFSLGQANADITTFKGSYGQANALIDSSIKNSYAQAQAIIYVKIYETRLIDTFTRVTGLITNDENAVSPPDLGPNYSEFIAASAAAEINGTKITQTATADYDFILFRSPVNIRNTEAQMDFFASEYGEFSYKEITTRHLTVAPFTNILIYIIDNTLYIKASNIAGDLDSTPFVLVNGTTYTLKINVDELTVKGKIWDTSTSEPDWMVTGTVPSLYNVQGLVQLYSDVGQDSAYPVTHTLDNFQIYESSLLPLRALYGQAQAKIKGIDINKTGQANAFIQGQFFKWAQAQSKINAFGVTSHGQALAQIKATEEFVGQARAVIVARRRVQAQAQAIISRKSYPTGQTQASIYRPQGYGQVQAYLCPGVLISDTFTRTTSSGTVDGPEVGPEYTEFISPGGDALVNGTQLVGTFNDDYGYVELRSQIYVRDSVITIDVKHNTITDWLSFIEILSRVGRTVNNGVSVYIYYDVDLDQMGVSVDGTPSILFTTLPKFDDDTFYTVKLSVTGENPIEIKTKVWKTSDPEPGAWLLESSYAPSAPLILLRDKGGLIFYGDSGEGFIPPHVITFDNLLAVGCLAPDTSVWGQAQAKIMQPPRVCGQAQARIRPIQGYGQARAQIKRTFRGHGLARARIGLNKWGFGQARVYMTGNEKRQAAQAQAHIAVKYSSTGQTQAYIQKAQGIGQAQSRILAFGQAESGQAQARVLAATTRNVHGQAKAYMHRMQGQGQAAALVSGGRYLAQFNNYQLPGYVQEESIESPMDIVTYRPIFQDDHLAEYIGLQNKDIGFKVTVIGATYDEVKRQVQQATTMVRSKRGYGKLYLQNYDKYYEAIGKSITLEKAVGESMRVGTYAVVFAAKPWLFRDTEHTITGSGLITTDAVGRDIYSGTWTPATVTLTGSDITVSGYTDTESYTGFISVEGAVTDYTVDNTQFIDTVVTDGVLYIGPNKTYFEINGASDASITWRDRWNL